MKKREIFLLSVAMIFLGTFIGFLCSPIKRGVRCGNNSGNNYYGGHGCCDELDCEEDMDEDDMPF
jgi:hypothetical protein